MMLRISPKYTMMPSVANTSAATGTPTIGPAPNRVQITKATYIPSMTKSPCAKLMMFIIPQIRVRPEENSAYTAPSSNPPTMTWTTMVDMEFVYLDCAEPARTSGQTIIVRA